MTDRCDTALTYLHVMHNPMRADHASIHTVWQLSLSLSVSDMFERSFSSVSDDAEDSDEDASNGSPGDGDCNAGGTD